MAGITAVAINTKTLVIVDEMASNVLNVRGRPVNPGLLKGRKLRANED